MTWRGPSTRSMLSDEEIEAFARGSAIQRQHAAIRTARAAADSDEPRGQGTSSVSPGGSAAAPAARVRRRAGEDKPLTRAGVRAADS